MLRGKRFFVIFLVLTQTAFGQIQQLPKTKQKTPKAVFSNDSIRGNRGNSKNTSNKNIKNKDAKIEHYLIISHKNDTTYVDTTLTIRKEYKFNYLLKDDFELMPFSNLGQTYNSLAYNYKVDETLPVFGSRARHFNYMEIEDINYYHVPTPLTELMYKTAFQQGQLLDAFFTVNTNERLNFSIAYKGLRSLGKYQHLLTSTGNFRFTTTYKTKNNRYRARGHIVMQDLLNQENGGLKDDNLVFFESGAADCRDRGVLEVNFENAENVLEGKRFHLEHEYDIITQKDSVSSNALRIGHTISFEDKFYQFDQTAALSSFFGDAFSSAIKDKVTLEHLYNNAQLQYKNNVLGDIKFNLRHHNYNYGYNNILVLSNQTITNRLKGDVFAVGGSYKNNIGKFNLFGEATLNVSGDFSGNYIAVNANYPVTKDIKLTALLSHTSRLPNYNTLLFQSDYTNYNWQNSFSNVETQRLGFKLQSKKIANLEVDLSTISDYVYFGQYQATNADNTEVTLVKPFQTPNQISVLKVKLSKAFKYKKITLENTVQYQNVQQDNNVLNVPQFITRNTLYYSNHFFKRALYLETGVTFKYFTEYYMNGYDPLLAEFYTQTNQKLGGYPLLDFFINAKVSQTRIYLKAEHFNSHWTGYNYYSAPNNPYRDFTVRFGLVWNFFL